MDICSQSWQITRPFPTMKNTQSTIINCLVAILLPKRYDIEEMHRMQVKNDNIETNYPISRAIAINEKGKIPMKIAKKRTTVKVHWSIRHCRLKRGDIPIKSEKTMKIE
jgi:hypothetical protein